MRGQTPKVAKQDKKKLPKGRAIKRLKVRSPTSSACWREPTHPARICRVSAYAARIRTEIATLTTLPPRVSTPQYNRRFVNVVVGLGKKRSPNSNAA